MSEDKGKILILNEDEIAMLMGLAMYFGAANILGAEISKIIARAQDVSTLEKKIEEALEEGNTYYYGEGGTTDYFSESLALEAIMKVLCA